MSNEKAIIIHLMAGLIKTHSKAIMVIIVIVVIIYKISQYFPKPYQRSGENINVKFSLSSYATKSDVNGATGADASNLASLKAEVDKVDV